MTIRERLAKLDSEGPAQTSAPNPLRDFAEKIADAAIEAYREALHVDRQNAKGIALFEVDEALDTYGIVLGYGELLAASKGLVKLIDSPPSEEALVTPVFLLILERFRKSIALSEKYLVEDERGEGKPTPEDAPL